MNTTMLKLIPLLVLLLNGCDAGPVEVTQIPSLTGRLLVANVTVVDTHDGKQSPGMNVLIDQGKIVSVTAEEDVPADKNTAVVDATGKFLVPGYMDMHTHVLEDEHPVVNLSLLLANGITSFRQMSGSYALLAKRKAGTLGIPIGAPSLLTMPGPIMTPLNAGSVEQAVVEVRKQRAAGADFIKIALVSKEVLAALLDEGKKIGIPVLGHVPENTSVLDAAKGGMLSIEHMGPIPGVLLNCSKDGEQLRIPSGNPPKIMSLLSYIPFSEKLFARLLENAIINPATRANADTFAQLDKLVGSYDQTLCEQSVNVFKENSTWLVPTIIRSKSSSLAFEPEFSTNKNLRYVRHSITEKWVKISNQYNEKLTDADRDTLRKTYDLNLKMVKLLSDHNVDLLAGDDSDGAGWLVPGFALHQEFSELAKAGLTPLKILQMATLNGAKYANMSDSLGSVDAGKIADLIILDDDPTQSAENLNKINAVIKDGHYFSRSALDSLLAQVELKSKE